MARHAIALAGITVTGLVNTITMDAPEPWQIGFQDGASPTFEGITELHNTIFFYLVLIGLGVTWMLGSVVVTFNQSTAPIAHRYANHGTLIEVVWTVTPALILVAIAFPSFKLLYLMDVPSSRIAARPYAARVTLCSEAALLSPRTWLY